MNPLLAIPALAQTGLGIYQMIEGSKDVDRPDYEIPESQKKATSLARRRASQTEIPGYDRAVEQLMSGQAASISGMQEATDSGYAMLGAIPKLTDVTADKTKDLNVASAEYKSRMQDKYINSLMGMAQQEQQKWMYDKQLPFEEESAMRSAMWGAGAQNIMGAGKSFVAGKMESDIQSEYLSLYRDMLSEDRGLGVKGGLMSGNNKSLFGDRSAYDLYAEDTFGSGNNEMDARNVMLGGSGSAPFAQGMAMKDYSLGYGNTQQQKSLTEDPFLSMLID